MEMIRLPPPSSLSMSVGEAMYTQRAIRRLDPNRPIADADIKTLLEAASKAPSGGNSQPARYLVLKDAAVLMFSGISTITFPRYLSLLIKKYSFPKLLAFDLILILSASA